MSRIVVATGVIALVDNAIRWRIKHGAKAQPPRSNALEQILETLKVGMHEEQHDGEAIDERIKRLNFEGQRMRMTVRVD